MESSAEAIACAGRVGVPEVEHPVVLVLVVVTANIEGNAAAVIVAVVGYAAQTVPFFQVLM